MIKLNKLRVKRLSVLFKRYNCNSKKNYVVDRLVRLYLPLIRLKSNRAEKDSGIASNEFESELVLKLFTALNKWDEHGVAQFHTYWSTVIPNVITNVIRREKKQKGHSTTYIEDCPEVTFLNSDDLNDGLSIRISEQRQLLDGLIDRTGKHSEQIRQICEAFLQSNLEKFSLRKVGDLVEGETKDTVDASIKRLRKAYDEKLFGKYLDYLVA